MEKCRTRNNRNKLCITRNKKASASTSDLEEVAALSSLIYLDVRPTGAKLVLIVMDHLSENDMVDFRVKDLAALCSMNSKTVETHLKRLYHLQFITRLANKNNRLKSADRSYVLHRGNIDASIKLCTPKKTDSGVIL